jgi:hypothetical protein
MFLTLNLVTLKDFLKLKIYPDLGQHDRPAGPTTCPV